MQARVIRFPLERRVEQGAPGFEQIGPYCKEALIVAAAAATGTNLSGKPIQVIHAEGFGVGIRLRP